MKKKISIIFILPDLETGGAERIVTTIANHLSRDLFDPKILLLRKEGGYLNLVKEDVEIIDIDTERIRHSLKPILKEIYKRKPQIVFSGFGEVNAYLSLFIKLFPSTKFIARETNVVSEHVTRKEIRFFYKFYNNYHQIIAQSDDMRQDLIGNFSVRESKIIKTKDTIIVYAKNKSLLKFNPQYTLQEKWDTHFNLFLEKDTLKIKSLQDILHTNNIYDLKIPQKKYDLNNIFLICYVGDL